MHPLGWWNWDDYHHRVQRFDTSMWNNRSFKSMGNISDSNWFSTKVKFSMSVWFYFPHFFVVAYCHCWEMDLKITFLWKFLKMMVTTMMMMKMVKTKSRLPSLTVTRTVDAKNSIRKILLAKWGNPATFLFSTCWRWWRQPRRRWQQQARKTSSEERSFLDLRTRKSWRSYNCHVAVKSRNIIIINQLLSPMKYHPLRLVSWVNSIQCSFKPSILEIWRRFGNVFQEFTLILDNHSKRP